MAITVSADVYAKMLERASAAKQLLGEWVVELLRRPAPPTVEAIEIPRAVARHTVRARVPRSVVIDHQAAAAATKLLLTDYFAAVVSAAVTEAS